MANFLRGIEVKIFNTARRRGASEALCSLNVKGLKELGYQKTHFSESVLLTVLEFHYVKELWALA